MLPHEIGHELFIRFLVPRTGTTEYGGGAPDWLDEMAALAFEDAAGVRMRRADALRFAERRELIPLARLLSMPHPEWRARTASGGAPTGSPTDQPRSSDTPAFYATVRALLDFLIARTDDERVIRLLAEQVRAGARLDKWLLTQSTHRAAAEGLAGLDDEIVAFVLTSQAPPKSAVPPPAASVDDAPPGDIEFTGPDGEPLPPEKQRELRERFKTDPSLVRAKPPPAESSEPSPDSGNKDIVITALRPRGSVIGDIPPTQTFNPLDIRAYGANDIGELLQAVGPQVSSSQGREDNGPVVLLNGKRISSFDEISKIPTEAIERMEVFPEELALKYGYRADQKVVNVVTLERYRSRTAQLLYAVPTEGGRDTAGINANYLNIVGNTRFNFNADYNRSDSLLERERGVLQAEGAPDPGQFRTLLPTAERLALNGTVSGEWLNGISSSLNGRFEASNSQILLGLGGDGPLKRDVGTRVSHLGTSLGGRRGPWQWSFTANFDRASTRTFTDTSDAGEAQNEARSVNALASADLVLSASVLKLPAGPISTTLRVGGGMRYFSSRSSSGPEQRTRLSRDRGTIGADIELPITARRRAVSVGLGDLSANVNFAIEELSDVGTLRTIGYGLSWSPGEALNLIASITNEDGAPTVEQLGAPLVITPNVPTFDFATGEVVDITRVFGGNPNLRSNNRHVLKLAVNAKPVAKADLTLSLDYIRTRVNHPIASFPVATPEIEAAFPERFTRSASGQLLQIDSRPLNFGRSNQEKVRWGINFAKPLGPVAPELQNARVRFAGSEADLQRVLPPGARIIKPERGSPEARRFENMSSRLIVSLYHTLFLVDEVLIPERGPLLDFLEGSAVDNRGGRPRHELELQLGAFKQGLGARVAANWRSGTIVRGLAAASGNGAGNLTFSDYTTVNINLFANLAERFGGAKAPAWLKGTRVSVGITNLFNTRPQVRDEAGLTPLSYQPAYLDPLGRSVNFSLRKVF